MKRPPSEALLLLLVLWLRVTTACAAPTVTPTATPTTAPSPEPTLNGMPPIPPTLIRPEARRTLTVNEAIDIALARNPQIAAQSKAVEAARWRLEQQFAGYYPSLDLNASQTHSESQNSVFIGGVATAANAVSSGPITTKRDNSSIQLSTSQILLDFGQRRLRVDAARETWEAARQDLERTRQTIVFNVRDAFFSAFVNQELVDIQQQTVAARSLRLRQAEGFYEAGVRARNEVTQARSDVAQAQLQLVRSLGTLCSAWVTLNVAMGLPRDDAYTLTLPAIETIDAPLDRTRLLSVALAWQPELRALQARIRAQIANLREVYAQRSPTISANAGYGFAGPPSPLDQAWSVGVRLNWNLFNGFLSHFQASEARALAENLLLQLEQARQQVYSQVETDYIGYEQSRTAIGAARVSVESAQENFRLAQQRYQVGLGNYLEFTDAQVSLARAQTDLAVAEKELRTARARLERDLGVRSLDALPDPSAPVQPDKIPGSNVTLPDPP